MKNLWLFLILFSISKSSFAFQTVGEGDVEVINIQGSCSIGTAYPLNKVELAAVDLAKAVASTDADFHCMYFGGAIRISDFTIQCTQDSQTAKVSAWAYFTCKTPKP